MTKAICTPFHRYHPHVGEYYKVQYDYFVESMKNAIGEVDKIYLIDSYFDFTKEDVAKLENLGFEVEIIMKEKDGHHWVQFATALPKLTQDLVLFLDNDVVINKKGVIAEWFRAAEGHTDLKSGEIKQPMDLVTAFDGSGGLKPLVQLKFPPLKLLGDFTRMGSYYFVANREVMELMKKTELGPMNPYPVGTEIPELNYTTKEGDWSDSFGLLTIRVFGKGMRVGYIEDDRSSIYLNDENKIDLEPTQPQSGGYYHIRNGNHPIHLLNCDLDEDKKDRDHSIRITPRRELLRLMMWFDYMQEKLGDTYREQIDSILAHPKIKVSKTLWKKYKDKFKEFHELS